jgi:hypothetical protein
MIEYVNIRLDLVHKKVVWDFTRRNIPRNPIIMDIKEISCILLGETTPKRCMSALLKKTSCPFTSCIESILAMFFSREFHPIISQSSANGHNIGLKITKYKGSAIGVNEIIEISKLFLAL